MSNPSVSINIEPPPNYYILPPPCYADIDRHISSPPPYSDINFYNSNTASNSNRLNITSTNARTTVPTAQINLHEASSNSEHNGILCCCFFIPVFMLIIVLFVAKYVDDNDFENNFFNVHTDINYS